MQTANSFWITLAGIAGMDAVDLEVRQAGRHHGEGVGFGDQRGGEDSHARRSSQRLRVRPLCSQSPLTCPSSRSSDRMPTVGTGIGNVPVSLRSEEHTSELQSLMRISYAVFCLKKQKI